MVYGNANAIESLMLTCDSENGEGEGDGIDCIAKMKKVVTLVKVATSYVFFLKNNVVPSKLCGSFAY